MPAHRHTWLFEPATCIAEYFKEHAARADIGKALELLGRAGDEPPNATLGTHGPAPSVIA